MQAVLEPRATSESDLTGLPTERRDRLFLAGGGEMGGLIRAHDWAATPLGPPETWPQPLKLTVRLMLNTKHPIYIWWGPELLCLYNDAYRASIGPERHPRSLGRPAREVWAEIWDIIGPDIDHVMAGRGSTWHENALVPITRHGRREDVYWTYSYGPIDDEQAPLGVGGVLVICSETTAQVQAVQATAADAARIAQMFALAPGAIAILRGPDHVYELANPAYLTLVGDREVLGRSAAEALPELVDQGFVTLLDRVYRRDEAVVGRDTPLLLTRADGAVEEVILDFIFQPMHDDTGAVSGIFVEGIDVTERARADRALRASEAQFQTFAEAMLNHVWTSQPDGELDWFNSRVYAYSGVAPGALNGVNWTDIVHPDDLPGAAERWAAALATGEDYETEFRLRRADGEYRWHIARAVALRDDSGAVVRWVGTNTEIEEQKAAAAALADINAMLEEQVAERTGELMAAEEALRQSQKMEAVGQLTGGIAHDFNNLLTGITGSLEMLETRIRQGRLEAIPRYVDAAQGAARRAAALTQRLLAFSRRQTLDPRPIEVNTLVGELEELIRRTVGPAVEIAVEGERGVWLTLVDPNQLENALLNLSINARDAMPHGGRLTIATANVTLDERAAKACELPPGDYVSVSVVDTGTGMTPAVIARAFDPFFTTKPLGQGTGLGLSMIYGFARQSGGQVRITSEVGRGTTMRLYLPRYLGETDGTTQDDRARAAAFDAHGETVLVVDDEATVRMLVVDTLEDAGYHAMQAGAGAAGLAILQSDARVDLLITDVGLPGGMNGRQLADAGRTLRPNLKVLFITGYAETVVLGSDHLDPNMQVITKPFAIDALGEKVREMLDA